ncbi:MAG: AMP-binding protein [Deltaproteobacteria bacterium]|nr:AMP-binding protein [Deltaproteobacteria bacterium]
MPSEIRADMDQKYDVQDLPPDGDTLPKLLRKHYLNHPDREVMREKDKGIWISYTWKDYYEKVKYFCLGLVRLGLKRGDKVSVIGENKPEWYWAELAVQAAGGTAVGIFVDCTPPEVKYFVEHSDSTFAVAHDQEQVDKFLDIKDEVPALKKVIYWDPKGLWGYRDDILMSFDEILELGRAYEKEHPDLFDEMVDQGRGGDIGVICYTSGTTGLPKGAMLNQRNSVLSVTDWSKLDNWYGKPYEYVSFVPPAWAVEQIIGISGSLVTGLVVNFPEKPETVQEDLREVGPHVIFYGARLWESVNRMVQARMLDSTFIRRLIYKTLFPVGLKVADIYIEGKEPALWWKALHFIAFKSVLRQLRDRLGLTNVKVVYSAGGALSPEIIRYFKALGIEIKLMYGSTESGIVSSPRDGEIRPETSGRITPWAQAKISEDGEILLKNTYMYEGYYKNQEATEKQFKDGWYCSGDFGHLDEDNHLIVIDRMDDLKLLAGGKKFSPQYAEVRLRFSPYVKDVIVVGSEDVSFVSALVNIDIENVGRFADAHRINYTTFTDLSQKPEVIELVKEEIAKINRTLPEHARLKRFINLHKELDADEAELTRTQKLRRTFIEDKYQEMIEALYGERDELTVEAQVTYRDGRTGLVKTDIKVNRLEV